MRMCSSLCRSPGVAPLSSMTLGINGRENKNFVGVVEVRSFLVFEYIDLNLVEMTCFQTS